MPRHRRLAPKAAVADVKTLGNVLRRAESFGFIDKNPIPAVKLPKAFSTDLEVFTFEEIHQQVAAGPTSIGRR